MGMGHGIILSIPNTLLPRSNAQSSAKNEQLLVALLTVPVALCPMPYAYQRFIQG